MLRHLENQGRDFAFLYEESVWPIELLEDSSHWIPAPDMESFIQKICHELQLSPEVFLHQVGMATPQLFAWGVLDSVLRMLPSPKSIFKNPGRFLSYFISPEPPIENLRVTDTEVHFDIPLLAEQYPLVTTYLKSAFSALPLYSGESAGHAEWTGIHFSIKFSQSQPAISLEATQKQLSPEMLEDLVEKLQKQQLELEEKNRELQNQNLKLAELYKEMQESATESKSVGVADGQPVPLIAAQISTVEQEVSMGTPAWLLTQNLAKLHDYMIRAQQLITVLLLEDRNPKAIARVLQKIDWEHVKTQYPQMIADSVKLLRKLSHQDSPFGPSQVFAPVPTKAESPNEIKNDTKFEMKPEIKADQSFSIDRFEGHLSPQEESHHV